MRKVSTAREVGHMTDGTVPPSGVIRIGASVRRRYSAEYKRRLANWTLKPGNAVTRITLGSNSTPTSRSNGSGGIRASKG